MDPLATMNERNEVIAFATARIQELERRSVRREFDPSPHNVRSVEAAVVAAADMVEAYGRGSRITHRNALELAWAYYFAARAWALAQSLGRFDKVRTSAARMESLRSALQSAILAEYDQATA